MLTSVYSEQFMIILGRFHNFSCVLARKSPSKLFLIKKSKSGKEQFNCFIFMPRVKSEASVCIHLDKDSVAFFFAGG